MNKEYAMARTGDSSLISRKTAQSIDADQQVHHPVIRRFNTHMLLAGLALTVIASTGTASAQAPPPDQRWYPWIGCWSSSQNGLTGAASRVCVVPAAGASAIDIVSLATGKVVSREKIEANGERRPSERDGCKGWETARWSSDM